MDIKVRESTDRTCMALHILHFSRNHILTLSSSPGLLRSRQRSHVRAKPDRHILLLHRGRLLRRSSLSRHLKPCVSILPSRSHHPYVAQSNTNKPQQQHPPAPPQSSNGNTAPTPSASTLPSTRPTSPSLPSASTAAPSSPPPAPPKPPRSCVTTRRSSSQKCSWR